MDDNNNNDVMDILQLFDKAKMIEQRVQPEDSKPVPVESKESDVKKKKRQPRKRKDANTNNNDDGNSKKSTGSGVTIIGKGVARGGLDRRGTLYRSSTTRVDKCRRRLGLARFDEWCKACQGKNRCKIYKDTPLEKSGVE